MVVLSTCYTTTLARGKHRQSTSTLSTTPSSPSPEYSSSHGLGSALPCMSARPQGAAASTGGWGGGCHVRDDRRQSCSTASATSRSAQCPVVSRQPQRASQWHVLISADFPAMGLCFPLPGPSGGGGRSLPPSGPRVSSLWAPMLPRVVQASKLWGAYASLGLDSNVNASCIPSVVL